MLADVMKDKEEFWMTNAEYEEKGLAVLDKLGSNNINHYFSMDELGWPSSGLASLITEQGQSSSAGLKVTEDICVRWNLCEA